MQLHWHTEPFLILSILLTSWLYALFVGPLKINLNYNKKVPLKYIISFYLGIIIIYLSVGSPLDSIAEKFLFSAHMIQHMLLIYIAPILIILGIPRFIIDNLIEILRIKRLLSILTHPACGGLLFTFNFTLWHVPKLYEAALYYKSIHILEHFTIFIFSILMLWQFLTNSKIVPKRSYPLRLVSVFLLMVGQLPVFAFLTLSGEPLYLTYEWAPRIIDLDPLNDQILGGLIMKITNMVFSLTLIGICFYKWANKNEA